LDTAACIVKDGLGMRDAPTARRWIETKKDKGMHSTVTVQVGPLKEEIDELIAPLIREIWIAGIETDMSCQGDEAGSVWICFPDETNLIMFLNVVAQYEEGANTLYNRINPRWQDLLSSPDAWTFELIPHDCGLDWDNADCESHDGHPDFFFAYSLRFPRSDLTTLFERLKRHNQGSELQTNS
jgi:hypothetical protein